MSTHFVKFRSNALNCNGEFVVHLPDKNLPPFLLQGNPNYNRPAKTLILLHGYSGDQTDWLYNSPVADFSMRYNLAIVMPSGGLDFYLNQAPTGRKYQTFIGEDLIKYLQDTFNIATKKEDTYIGGLSMGGFGALHTGFAYPEKFNGIIALSSALIIHQLKNMTPDSQNEVMANYEYYVSTFGDLSKAENSPLDPEYLFTQNQEKGIENPEIFMACGSEDFLIEPNRAMAKFLKEHNANLTYVEHPGIHNWDFWNLTIKEGLEHFFNK